MKYHFEILFDEWLTVPVLWLVIYIYTREKRQLFTLSQVSLLLPLPTNTPKQSNYMCVFVCIWCSVQCAAHTTINVHTKQIANKCIKIIPLSFVWCSCCYLFCCVLYYFRHRVNSRCRRRRRRCLLLRSWLFFSHFCSCFAMFFLLVLFRSHSVFPSHSLFVYFIWCYSLFYFVTTSFCICVWC